jgi:outer membrane lipoprotein carrier protein
VGYNTPEALFIASKVQAYYNKTQDFKAKFKQTYSKAFHGPETPRFGYLWVKKPGLMRWDYAAPHKRQLICDGKKIWIYVPGDRQVFWRDLLESALPTAITFLWGKGDITSEFYVTLVGGSKYASPKTIVMKLLPKQPNSNFKHVLFVVETATGMVSQSLLFDHLGNKNHYFFTEPVVNSGVPNASFQFTPPAGVRVIKATDDVQP